MFGFVCSKVQGFEFFPVYIPPSVRCSKVESGHTNFFAPPFYKIRIRYKKAHKSPIQFNIIRSVWACVRSTLCNFCVVKSYATREAVGGSVRFVASRSVCGFG